MVKSLLPPFFFLLALAETSDLHDFEASLMVHSKILFQNKTKHPTKQKSNFKKQLVVPIIVTPQLYRCVQLAWCVVSTAHSIHI